MMPRIRSVKPELFKHEKLFQAEIDERLPLRVAFIALFGCCDKEGRFCWQPRRLKVDMLPYDDVNMSEVLEALVKHGFIKKYEVQGEVYGYIPSWSKHQKKNFKEAESILPAPKLSTEFEYLQSTAIEAVNINKNKKIVVETPSEMHVEFNECTIREPFVSHEWVHLGSREEKGEEGNRKGGEGNNTIVASETRQRPSMESSMQQIFEHWKAVMHHPNAKLDPKRKALIGKALSFGYSLEQLCHAISGCSITPHNIGDNERGQRYDGLHVILRDSDQIDRFIHNYHTPPRRLSEAERKTQANVQSLRQWMTQKMQEENARANV